jgi:predicted deacylase
VLDGAPDPVPPTHVLRSFDWLRSPAEGFFRCVVRVDQRVKEGEVVGELVDLVGDPIAMVRAPVTGVVLFIVTSPALKKDGLLLAIGAL